MSCLPLKAWAKSQFGSSRAANYVSEKKQDKPPTVRPAYKPRYAGRDARLCIPAREREYSFSAGIQSQRQSLMSTDFLSPAHPNAALGARQVSKHDMLEFASLNGATRSRPSSYASYKSANVRVASKVRPTSMPLLSKTSLAAVPEGEDEQENAATPKVSAAAKPLMRKCVSFANDLTTLGSGDKDADSTEGPEISLATFEDFARDLLASLDIAEGDAAAAFGGVPAPRSERTAGISRSNARAEEAAARRAQITGLQSKSTASLPSAPEEMRAPETSRRESGIARPISGMPVKPALKHISPFAGHIRLPESKPRPPQPKSYFSNGNCPDRRLEDNPQSLLQAKGGFRHEVHWEKPTSTSFAQQSHANGPARRFGEHSTNALMPGKGKAPVQTVERECADTRTPSPTANSDVSPRESLSEQDETAETTPRESTEYEEEASLETQAGQQKIAVLEV